MEKPFLVFGYHIETRRHMAEFFTTPAGAMSFVEIGEKDGWAVGLQILSDEARREFTEYHRQRVNIILSDARKMDEGERKPVVLDPSLLGEKMIPKAAVYAATGLIINEEKEVKE